MVDHLCASQIAARDGLTMQELAADLRRWTRDAPRKLESVPGPVRRVSMPAPAGFPPGSRLSYVPDVINTRDDWMHRVDLARALDRERQVTVAEPEAVNTVVRDLDTTWAGPTVIRATAHGTGTAALHGPEAEGKPYTMTTMHIYRTEGDRLAEHWGVRDEVGVLRQLGLVPPPGQPPR